MHFTLGQEEFLKSAFGKFAEWDTIAQTNKVQDFEKEIGSCPDYDLLSLDHVHHYSFHWNSELSSFWDSGAEGVFYKKDILNFQQLLERLPAIKSRLAQKIQSKAAEKNLFK